MCYGLYDGIMDSMSCINYIVLHYVTVLLVFNKGLFLGKTGIKSDQNQFLTVLCETYL